MAVPQVAGQADDFGVGDDDRDEDPPEDQQHGDEPEPIAQPFAEALSSVGPPGPHCQRPHTLMLALFAGLRHVLRGSRR